MKYQNSCIVYSILHMIWIFTENWRRPFMKSYTAWKTVQSRYCISRLEIKSTETACWKCRTWTRVHERQTKVGVSWSQMAEDNVNTEPEKQQFNTQFVIIEWKCGSYISLYTKDQEHTRSITTTFIFFALRLFKIHLKLSVFPLQKLH